MHKTTTYHKDIEHPILYNLFISSQAQRNYGTYKRKLLTMVESARKYNYFVQGPVQSVFLIDCKPLTTFFDSSAMKGICRRAMELRTLNIRIKFIPRKRDRVADALSRSTPTARTRLKILVRFMRTRTVQDGQRRVQGIPKTSICKRTSR
jgi:reverse transcriptase-like protein